MQSEPHFPPSFPSDSVESYFPSLFPFPHPLSHQSDILLYAYAPVSYTQVPSRSILLCDDVPEQVPVLLSHRSVPVLYDSSFRYVYALLFHRSAFHLHRSIPVHVHALLFRNPA